VDARFLSHSARTTERSDRPQSLTYLGPEHVSAMVRMGAAIYLLRIHVMCIGTISEHALANPISLVVFRAWRTGAYAIKNERDPSIAVKRFCFNPNNPIVCKPAA
jgi:hypothetical protein